jgi:hypothetical protein
VLRALTAAVIILAAQTALATVDANAPVGGKPYEEQLNSGNEKFLMELKRRVENSGFDEVDILPSMFVMTARSRSGQNVTLVVNSDTLHALQIGADKQTQAGPCAATPEALRQMK